MSETKYHTPPIKTDHKALQLNIRFGKFTTGRGYPRVKNTLYSHPDFVNKVASMIDETMESHKNCNPETTLDLILFNTSTIAQAHTEETRDNHNNSLKFLNLEIKTIEAQLDSTLLQKPMKKAQENYLKNSATDSKSLKFTYKAHKTKSTMISTLQS